MNLTLILGPMKSGKSFDLISHFSPLPYTDTKFALYQPVRNVRDAKIESRSGLSLEAKKVSTLASLVDDTHDVVGIDEMHMFAKEDVRHIRDLLVRGTHVVVSGLDTDYKGAMFDTIKALFELGPTTVTYKRAVCARCRDFSAIHTQVYNDGEPMGGGMPSVIPDDGTYTYEPVCRSCFVAA